MLLFAGLSSVSVAQNTERRESEIAAERASGEITKAIAHIGTIW